MRQDKYFRPDTKVETLACGFFWGSTPEGHEFWLKYNILFCVCGLFPVQRKRK